MSLPRPLVLTVAGLLLLLPIASAARGAVVNRKTSGGNRSPAGARPQAVLTSVLRTCHQQHLNPFEILTDLLRAQQPRPSPQPSCYWLKRGR